MPPPPFADTWEKLKEIFSEISAMDDLARKTFLEALGQSDPSMEKELRSLLMAHDSAIHFLEEPILPQVARAFAETKPIPMEVGTQISDFEIKKVLGAGAFGTVYLAKQISLDRDVAIKITPNLGHEAKTMAPLEHDNIVKVYSQTLLPDRNLRLVCMQYVPGMSLDQLLALLEPSSFEIRGKDLLKILENSPDLNTTFNPGALKDRENLVQLDAVSTVLWIGSKLAHALAAAHHKGVLHLDVKPGNILMNLFGRPMLTDFNISLQPSEVATGGLRMFGGTLNYMSPEHQKAFNYPEIENMAKLDPRSDIFSLGVLLQELYQQFTGLNPLESKDEDLRAALIKSTESDPSQRFSSALEFAEALEACQEHREILLNLPPPGFLMKLSLQFPITALFLLVLFPQLFGSVVNISYNSTQIVGRLNFAQQILFQKMCLYYNPLIYGIAIGILLWRMFPLIRFQRNPQHFFEKGSDALRNLRAEVVSYPLWIAWITIACWGLGSLFFPLGLHFWEGPISRGTFLHFFVSFFLSALIALSYSFLYSQSLCLRVFYPRLWMGQSNIRSTARLELAPISQRIRLFFLLTGIIPLTAAFVLVFIGPEPLATGGYSVFRLMVSLLIISGIVGFAFALRTSAQVSRVLLALSGSAESKPLTQRR